MTTSKRIRIGIAVLIILACCVSLIGISPQAAEACEAAKVICAGAYSSATAFCAKAGVKWWECAAAMAAATIACAGAWLLCGSS